MKQLRGFGPSAEARTLKIPKESAKFWVKLNCLRFTIIYAIVSLNIKYFIESL